MVDRSSSTAASSGSPTSSGRPLDKARILLEDAGLAKVVVAVPRELRGSRHRPRAAAGARPDGLRGHRGHDLGRPPRLPREPAGDLPPLRRGRPQPRPRHVLRVRAHVRLGRARTSTDGWRFYDPHVAPPEFLDWLAALDRVHRSTSTGPRRKKRALIKRAVDLYRIRGTKRGLALFLKLFTGHEPDIEENTWPFKGFRVEARAPRRRARRPRLGGPAAGRPRALLRRRRCRSSSTTSRPRW